MQIVELCKLTGFGRPNGPIALSIAARAELFAGFAAADAAAIEKSDLSESAKAWRAWAQQAGNGAAAMAHRYVKAPLSINHSDTHGNQRSRADELSNEASNWSRMWNEGATCPHLDFRTFEALPPLWPEQVMEASFSFKRATCALWGIHPRHIGVLSPQAIAALIAILHVAEAIGVMPHQLLSSFIALVPKSAGGLRPIALCQSVTRIWMKVRYQIVRKWEIDKTHHLPFAAQKCRSPSEVVWRHAFKAEAAQSSNVHFACLLWDLLKCYEVINHANLLRAGIKHSYPIAILRICICLYLAPRRILYKGLVSRPIAPTRGILAGVSTATSELRLILLDMVQNHVMSHPAVHLNVFIDDIALDSVANTKAGLIEDTKVAATDLSAQLDQAGLIIAETKSAVIANSLTTATSLRRLLGSLGGPPLGVVRPLAIDFWGGNPACNRVRPVRLIRRNHLLKKQLRLKKIRAAAPAVAAKVFSCGAIPALCFDCPVYGLFDRALEVARRQAGVFACLRGRRKAPNLSLAFQPAKDLEVISSLSVLGAYCREVWNAGLIPVYRDSSGLTLETLARGVQGYLDCNKNLPF